MVSGIMCLLIAACGAVCDACEWCAHQLHAAQFQSMMVCCNCHQTMTSVEGCPADTSQSVDVVMASSSFLGKKRLNHQSCFDRIVQTPLKVRNLVILSKQRIKNFAELLDDLTFILCVWLNSFMFSNISACACQLSLVACCQAFVNVRCCSCNCFFVQLQMKYLLQNSVASSISCSVDDGLIEIFVHISWKTNLFALNLVQRPENAFQPHCMWFSAICRAVLLLRKRFLLFFSCIF